MPTFTIPSTSAQPEPSFEIAHRAVDGGRPAAAPEGACPPASDGRSARPACARRTGGGSRAAARASARALLAVRLLLLRLGQVQLHPEAVFQRVFSRAPPTPDRSRCIPRGCRSRFGCGRRHSRAICRGAPRLRGSRVGIGVKIVGAVGRDGVAEIGLDAGFRDGLGDGVRAEIHIADGGHAEAQALGDGQQRRSLTLRASMRSSCGKMLRLSHSEAAAPRRSRAAATSADACGS